jgi:hypothetical protein
MTLKKPHHRPDPRPQPSLFRTPLRAAADSDDPSDVQYILELTVVDTLGNPVSGVELSMINNNNGNPSSRYSDGSGYTNHGLLGRPDDLLTFQTNGFKIVAATGQPAIGPQYLYLPAGTAHVTLQLSLDSFKQGLRPTPPAARGPLPPYLQPINYRTVMPWTPPVADRDYMRGDAWGVVMENAPIVGGTSTRHPERILSWFLDRYTLDFQKAYLEKYASFQYTHLKLSLADSCGKIDNGVNSPPGNAQTLDQFIETCALVKRYVPYTQVMLGSKYFADFEGRLGNCPNHMSAQQWADWADPILDRLIAAKVLDECILGWEWNLWNNPGEDSIEAFKHAGAKCHAAGVSFWQHFGPHYTSWQADGDDRGRFGWYDDIAGYVDGLNYQTMGAHWSPKMLQDRMVDTLWLFGQRGNDFKFRLDEDFATFMWDNDVVSVQVDDQVDDAGNPVLTSVSVTPEDANLRDYIGCCTIDDVKHTDAKVWGYMNGGRRPDGSRL